jgi:hypothetical protein
MVIDDKLQLQTVSHIAKLKVQLFQLAYFRGFGLYVELTTLININTMTIMPAFGLSF